MPPPLPPLRSRPQRPCSRCPLPCATVVVFSSITAMAARLPLDRRVASAGGTATAITSPLPPVVVVVVARNRRYLPQKQKQRKKRVVLVMTPWALRTARHPRRDGSDPEAPHRRPTCYGQRGGQCHRRRRPTAPRPWRALRTRPRRRRRRRLLLLPRCRRERLHRRCRRRIRRGGPQPRRSRRAIWSACPPAPPPG